MSYEEFLLKREEWLRDYFEGICPKSVQIVVQAEIDDFTHEQFGTGSVISNIEGSLIIVTCGHVLQNYFNDEKSSIRVRLTVGEFDAVLLSTESEANEEIGILSVISRKLINVPVMGIRDPLIPWGRCMPTFKASFPYSSKTVSCCTGELTNPYVNCEDITMLIPGSKELMQFCIAGTHGSSGAGLLDKEGKIFAILIGGHAEDPGTPFVFGIHIHRYLECLAKICDRQSIPQTNSLMERISRLGKDILDSKHKQMDNIRARLDGSSEERPSVSEVKTLFESLQKSITIVQPGPLIGFLLANQNVQDPYKLDWVKAKRTLKNLRVSVKPGNTEWRICGLSEDICNNQRFTLRRRSAERDGDNFVETELTVSEYFAQYRKIKLDYSGYLPCVNVAKPKRPIYIPIELCSLLPLQRYTKALTVHQQSSLVEKSRQKPRDKIRTLTDVMRRSNYAAEPLLLNCGITISKEFMQVEGRMLEAPQLEFGDVKIFPKNGRWNVMDKKFSSPVTIKNWVVVNFSTRCKICDLCENLVKCGEMKGIEIPKLPLRTFEEKQQYRREPPSVRVDKMADQVMSVMSRLRDKTSIILCVLADRKNSEIYGPWKKKALVELGVITRCLAPQGFANERYLTNLLLKINAKLGGVNHRLAVERNIPVLIDKPMIIFGMDVYHGSPGQSGVPSIAAVVSSRASSIYRYRASVRSQSPKVEMIESLYQPLPTGEDGGIIRELLEDFYRSSSPPVKPSQVIVFRDGVSESQFKQVLNIEFEQILQACKALDESWSPKFTIIIAQKNHHTKFFKPESPNNVPPGTVVDSKVCHPLYYDFYMCAQAGMIGTSRPTHYHVLLDEIGFSADQLQELIHSLSYVYQRSTTAISIAAPIRYAHLAATQVSQFLKYEDLSETSSGHGSMTSVGNPSVPEIPKLHDRVCTSMFFC